MLNASSLSAGTGLVFVTRGLWKDIARHDREKGFSSQLPWVAVNKCARNSGALALQQVSPLTCRPWLLLSQLQLTPVGGFLHTLASECCFPVGNFPGTSFGPQYTSELLYHPMGCGMSSVRCPLWGGLEASFRRGSSSKVIPSLFWGTLAQKQLLTTLSIPVCFRVLVYHINHFPRINNSSY